MRRSFYIIFFITIPFITYSQISELIDNIKSKNVPPNLTKEQMYTDFDSLISIINYYNPQIEARRTVTNTDIMADILKLRSNIDSIININDFIVLLYKVIKTLQDQHCDIGSNVWYYNESIFKKAHRDLKLNEKIYGYNFHYQDFISESIDLLLKIVYIDNQFYLQNSLSLWVNNEEIIIKEGTIISKINDLSVNEFIFKYRNIQSDISWNSNQNLFFTNYLYKPKELKIVNFEFETSNHDKNTYSCDSFHINIIPFNPIEFGKAPIYYFNNDSTLYIRCPRMAENKIAYYASEIDKYKSENIKSVVIDIRGNYGGSDKLWMNLIENIISDTIKTKIVLGLNKNKYAASMYSKRRRSGFEEKKLIFLDNKDFYIIDNETEVYSPSKNSLNYSGEILILQDEEIYSSAGGFTATAQKSDKLKTVGMRTGKLLGRGVTPSIFLLPESKFILEMETIIDLSEVNCPIDLYHDSVEMLLNLPIEYYTDRANTTEYLYSKEYLYDKDLFFKEVLKYIHSIK
jgi:hypothetical protein